MPLGDTFPSLQELIANIAPSDNKIGTFEDWKPIIKGQVDYLSDLQGELSMKGPEEKKDLLATLQEATEDVVETNKALLAINEILASHHAFVYQSEIRLSFNGRIAELSTIDPENDKAWTVPRFKQFKPIKDTTAVSTPQQLILLFGLLSSAIDRAISLGVDIGQEKEEENMVPRDKLIKRLAKLIGVTKEKLDGVLKFCSKLVFIVKDSGGMTVHVSTEGVGKSHVIEEICQILTELGIPWVLTSNHSSNNPFLIGYDGSRESDRFFRGKHKNHIPLIEINKLSLFFQERFDESFSQQAIDSALREFSEELMKAKFPKPQGFMVAPAAKRLEVLIAKSTLTDQNDANTLHSFGLYPYVFCPSSLNFRKALTQHAFLTQYSEPMIQCKQQDADQLGEKLFGLLQNGIPWGPSDKATLVNSDEKFLELVDNIARSTAIITKLPADLGRLLPSADLIPMLYLVPKHVSSDFQPPATTSLNNHSSSKISSKPKRSAEPSTKTTSEFIDDLYSDLSIFYHMGRPTMRNVNYLLRQSSSRFNQVAKDLDDINLAIKKQGKLENLVTKQLQLTRLSTDLGKDPNSFTIPQSLVKTFQSKMIPPKFDPKHMNPITTSTIWPFPFPGDPVEDKSVSAIPNGRKTSSFGFEWWFTDSILTAILNYNIYLPFKHYNDAPLTKVFAAANRQLFHGIPLNNSHLIDTHSYVDADEFIQNHIPDKASISLFIPKSGEVAVDFYAIKHDENNNRSLLAVQLAAQLPTSKQTHEVNINRQIKLFSGTSHYAFMTNQINPMPPDREIEYLNAAVPVIINNLAQMKIANVNDTSLLQAKEDGTTYQFNRVTTVTKNRQGKKIKTTSWNLNDSKMDAITKSKTEEKFHKYFPELGIHGNTSGITLIDYPDGSFKFFHGLHCKTFGPDRKS